MKLIRYQKAGEVVRFGAVVDNAVADLSEAKDPGVRSLGALLTDGAPVAELYERLQKAVEEAPRFEAAELLASGRQTVDGVEVRLVAPIDRQEVWASGVTYKRSEEARKAESEGAARFYALVYEADRPELFFKATPHRTVGPFEAVGIRRDAKWNVPEPELGVVVTSRMEIFGYTVGNDMSSRDIEGENPLYLPQAKVYERACGLGPGIVPAMEIADAKKLTITLRILRDGRPAFEGSTGTDQMKRDISELVGYLGRSNRFPDGAVLLTGTGIVPDDSFTLEEGDVVEISIDGIGALVNPVVRVG